MNKPELNEDVENVIKTFMPDIERWRSLRKVYTTAYLKERLEKKTVVQLTLIQTNLIEMVNTGELSGLRNFFHSYDMDIEELKTRASICWSTLDKWKNIRGKKEDKIKKILKFVCRLGNTINRKHLDGFGKTLFTPRSGYSYDILTLVKKQLNREKQHIWAPKALKVLLLLVYILNKPNKKRERKVTVTAQTEVD